MKHHFFGRQTWEFPRHKESLEEFGPCETTPKPEFRSSVSIYTGWWLSLPLWKMMEWSPLGWLFHSQLIWTNINFMFQSPPTSVCWFINHYNPHWLTIVIPVISTINHMLMVPVTTNHIYIYYQWIGSREHFTGPPPKKKLGKISGFRWRCSLPFDDRWGWVKTQQMTYYDHMTGGINIH